MRAVDIRRKILPDYAIIPTALWLIGLGISYYFSRLINFIIHNNSYDGYFDISFPVDEFIPLIPAWVYVYVLTYPFWLVCFLLIAKEEKELCCRAFTADFIGKIIGAAIFIALPTFVVRPEVPSDTFPGWLLNGIYFLDTPDNLFPSMHCSVSWIAVRYVLKCKKAPDWYKAFSVVMVILICLSVVFTKQHVVADIFGGLLLAELCTQLCNRTNIYKLYYKMDIGKFYESKRTKENA